MRALDALSEALEIGGGPRRFFEGMARGGEPYELGAALSLDGRAALIAYNPRRRGGDSRRRMLAALGDFGLDPRPAAAAFALVPEAAASTVLGLEWRRGCERPEATVYLEELARRGPPRRVAGQLRGLARLVGVDIGAEIGRPGPIYILALDLGPGGPSALKVYREAGPEQAAGVRAELRRFAGGAVEEGPLFRGAPASGYIAQRRYAPGRPSPHKVYKCYPYLRPGADLDLARAELAGLLEIPLPDPLAASPPTSLGLRFQAGHSSPIGGTAYWALRLRGITSPPRCGR